MALGHQPISTMPLGAIAVAGSAPGIIQPAHHPSGALVLAPVARFAIAASGHSNATSFGAPKIRLSIAPVVLGSGNAFYAAELSAGVTILPGSFANGSNFHGVAIAGTCKPAAHANGQSFFAASLSLSVTSASFANANAHYPSRIALRLFSAFHANANALYAPTTFQPGMLSAPLVASGGTVFSPGVLVPNTFQVTGVLNLAGWTPRALARRPRVATWPDLPSVDAPPWRLTVVTSNIARQRVRAQLAWRRRVEHLQREREIDRRVEAICAELIDEEVVRTVVRLAAERV